MKLLSCCIYGIRFEVYFSTAFIRFQGCAKYLIKGFDKTIQIQLRQHYSQKRSIYGDLNHKKILYTLVRQCITGEAVNGMFNVRREFRLISHHCFSFPKLIQFLKMTFRQYLELAFRRDVNLVNYTVVKNNIKRGPQANIYTSDFFFHFTFLSVLFLNFCLHYNP